MIWNWVQFRMQLARSEGKTIYEISSEKDRYWGVIPRDTGFDGENHLGKLLMEHRDEYLGAHNEDLRILTAPAHLRLRFLGVEIQTLDRRSNLGQSGTRMTEQVKYLAA